MLRNLRIVTFVRSVGVMMNEKETPPSDCEVQIVRFLTIENNSSAEIRRHLCATYVEKYGSRCSKKGEQIYMTMSTKGDKHNVKAHPHLYTNKTCGSEANANECQKVACSAFAAQANEQVLRWLFVGCMNEYKSTSV